MRDARRQAWLWLPALMAGGLVAGIVMYGMIGRIAYPYDLEWMEGGQLAHAWRLLHGQGLYPEPGPEWIPYIYPPGYSMIVAALASVFGLSAPLGRAVSWFGTALGCVSIAALLIRQQAGKQAWIGGLIGAACYLSCWVAAGTFLDLVRPDALAVGLLLASLALSLERSAWLQILGGLLLALAFWCKHPLALFGLPLTLGLWARDAGSPWSALRVGLAALVPAGLAVGVQQLLEPSFLTYLLVVPASHGTIPQRMLPLTPWELGQALPAGVLLVTLAALFRLPATDRGSRVARWCVLGVAVAAGLLALLIPQIPRAEAAWYGIIAGSASLAAGLGVVGLGIYIKARRGAVGGLFWLGVGLGVTGLLLAAWMRGHVGGFVNVHLPMFAVACVGIGWAVNMCERRLVRGVVSVALALQLGWAAWSVPLLQLVPTQGQVDAGDRLVAALAGIDGPVWSPVAPYLPVQAGHPPGPHQIALWDVANHRSGPWPRTRARFERAVASHHWAAIVQGRRKVHFGIEEHYATGRLVRVPRSFRPRYGWANAPADILFPAPLRGVPGDAPVPGR